MCVPPLSQEESLLRIISGEKKKNRTGGYNGGINAGTTEVKEGAVVAMCRCSVLTSDSPEINTSSNVDYLLTVLSLK